MFLQGHERAAVTEARLASCISYCSGTSRRERMAGAPRQGAGTPTERGRKQWFHLRGCAAHIVNILHLAGCMLFFSEHYLKKKKCVVIQPET